MTGPRVDDLGRTARDYESHDRVYAHHNFGFPQYPANDGMTWVADDGSRWRYTGGVVQCWCPFPLGATELAPRNGDPAVDDDDAVNDVLRVLMAARGGWRSPSELMTLADELAPLAEAIAAAFTLTRKDPTT